MGCLYSPQYTRHVLNTGRVPPRDIAVEFAVFEHAFHARGAGCVPLGNVAIELPVEAHGENACKVLDLGHVHVVKVAFEATHLEQRGDELEYSSQKHFLKDQLLLQREDQSFELFH